MPMDRLRGTDTRMGPGGAVNRAGTIAECLCSDSACDGRDRVPRVVVSCRVVCCVVSSESKSNPNRKIT